MTPTLVMVGVGVGMREDIRQQLSRGQRSTRREVKGHTPTPTISTITTTTIRGVTGEGEMGESAVCGIFFFFFRNEILMFYFFLYRKRPSWPK